MTVRRELRLMIGNFMLFRLERQNGEFRFECNLLPFALAGVLLWWVL